MTDATSLDAVSILQVSNRSLMDGWSMTAAYQMVKEGDDQYLYIQTRLRNASIDEQNPDLRKISDTEQRIEYIKN